VARVRGCCGLRWTGCPGRAGQYLAGCLIAVVLATGRTVEAAAERRASRDLRALLERSPRTAPPTVAQRCSGHARAVAVDVVAARGGRAA
jgi:cation transport ATPase